MSEHHTHPDPAVRQRIAEARAEAWDEGHKHRQRRDTDDGCRCGAWAEHECGCGKYGSGALLSLADNPYRAEQIGGDQ